jgi:hypothetical protein
VSAAPAGAEAAPPRRAVRRRARQCRLRPGPGLRARRRPSRRGHCPHRSGARARRRPGRPQCPVARSVRAPAAELPARTPPRGDP